MRFELAAFLVMAMIGTVGCVVGILIEVIVR